MRVGARGLWLLAVVAIGLVATPIARATTPGPTVGAFDGGPLPPNPKVHIARNRDYEPGAAVAPDGSIWVAASVQFVTSADDPRDKGISGEDIWRSTDGGHSFHWVADPADLVGGGSKTATGGGDTDITTATAFNPDGTFNVYAVTGWVGSMTLSISRNSGRSWTTTPVSTASGDRPWLAADGACVLYLTHKSVSTIGAEFVERFDVCSPSGSLVSTTSASSSSPHLLVTAGKPAIDHAPTSPRQHALYIPVMGCAPADGGRGCTGATSLDVDSSRDGGKTFTRSHVADGPGRDAGIFPQIATDAAGNVYVTWSDGARIGFGVSRDGGRTWRARLLDSSGYVVAALPQIAADRPGEVVLSWYGSSVAESRNVVVYVARSLDGGRTFAAGVASPVILVGRVCSSTNETCSSNPNDNDLRDDFAVVIHPATHKVTVAYTSDRPEGDRSHDFIGYATER